MKRTWLTLIILTACFTDAAAYEIEAKTVKSQMPTDCKANCECRSEISYPFLKNLADINVAETINAAINGYVETSFSGASGLECSQQEETKISYEIKYQSAELLSILFHNDFHSAANSASYSDGFNFDLKTGQRLTVDNIVNPEDYEKLLDFIDGKLESAEESLGGLCGIRQLDDESEPVEEIIKHLTFYMDKDKKTVIIPIDEKNWAQACGKVEMALPVEFVGIEKLRGIYK